ncbi:MAG TPA: MazG family protein, partial [Beijerinckiaceae bacterium]
MTKLTPSRDIARLIEIMARLRTPGTGCPWDLEQDFATIAPYTIEEAYEVADAIARGDLLDLRDELGDLLLQVAFHARMAEEAGAFGFGDVVESITAKLLRRHPHVFGDAGTLSTEAVNALWGEIKRAEKAARRRERGLADGPADEAPGGVLAGVPAGLPALAR